MTQHNPIFQSIFGEQWFNLPTVMHRHYANRPHSHDEVIVEGKMSVKIASFMKLLTPILRFTGILVPHSGDNIPVTVHFRSEKNSNAYCFDRIFYFPNQKPYHFRSRMIPQGGNQVVELMGWGIGWHARYYYDGQKIRIEHEGYKLNVFGRMIHLPIEFMFGKGFAQEEAISHDTFRMHMCVQHPIFGQLYAYSGEFTVKSVNLKDGLDQKWLDHE